MAIQSFEVSQNDEFGDILSKNRKRKEKKLRVGLLCAAWFEWYEMFPNTDFRRIMQQDAECVRNHLQRIAGDRFEIIYPGTVDTLDNAHDIGYTFESEHIDVIILVENTYVTDYIPLEVLDHIPHVPVIVFSTQASRELPANMDNIETVRYEGLVGISQLIGAFRKMGREYRVVVGASDNPDTYEKLTIYLLVLYVYKKIRNVDLGLLGHTFRGMYDIEIDKTKLKSTLGPNILYVDVKHFLQLWEKISDAEIIRYQKELDAAWPIPIFGVEEEDIQKSLRVGLALRQLAERFHLDGISVLGQHHLEIATKASADFGHFTLEESGVMHTCEGDLANLTMKITLKLLGHSTPVFLEWTAFDEPANSLLLTHHGVVDPRLCADINKCRWTPSPEKWDFTGNGLSIEYCAKAGDVTLASYIDDADGWKLLISEGQCIEIPPKPSFAPQFYFQPNGNVIDYIESILSEGVAHHICLAYGKYRKHLEILADYLNIRKVYI